MPPPAGALAAADAPGGAALAAADAAGAASAALGALPVPSSMHAAFADLVAHLDPDLLHRAAQWRRHVHGRLVRFERDDRVLGLHAVADLDEDLDHRHVLEVADVGHAHLGYACGRANRRGRRAALGLRFGRGAGGARAFALELHHHAAFADLVADLHRDRLDGAAAAARGRPSWPCRTRARRAGLRPSRCRRP